MTWAVIGVLVILGAWIWSRGGSGNRADNQKELDALVQQHSSLAARVVDLSDRAERYRQGEGATGKAFAHAEGIFMRVSAEYSDLTDQVEAMKAAAAKRNWEPLRTQGGGLTRRLSAMQGLLDEFSAALDTYQAGWQAAPGEVAQAAEQLRALSAEVAQVEQMLGLQLDLGKQVERMNEFMARIRQILDQGNPTEAALKVKDLQLAMDRCHTELQRYQSASGAIAAAAEEIQEAQRAAEAAGKAADPAVIEALGRAQAEHGRLLPALKAGHDQVLQDALVALQDALRSARRTLKG